MFGEFVLVAELELSTFRVLANVRLSYTAELDLLATQSTVLRRTTTTRTWRSKNFVYT
jgi:hypothetical protein